MHGPFDFWELLTLSILSILVSRARGFLNIVKWPKNKNRVDFAGGHNHDHRIVPPVPLREREFEIEVSSSDNDKLSMSNQ